MSISHTMEQTRKHLFSLIDYSIFASTLVISMMIGVYFAWFRKKQNTVNEYLNGGKTMKVLPIAVSLIASKITTSTLLAAPVDIYRFGANYIWLSLAILIECFVGYHLFLTVFFKLDVRSLFEYLNLRFDRRLQILASFLSLLNMLLLSSLVIYLPSLVFSQVTGVNVILTAIVSSLVCVFYTTIGGFKTVVWTDVLQFFVMIIAFVAMFCLGMSKINGFDTLWETSVKGHRLNIFDFDPTLRDSFGSVLIGGGMYWLNVTCVSPVAVQKLLSVPTLKDVKKIIIIYAIGVALIHIFVTFTGLLIYTTYSKCDPILTKRVSKFEELVPYFVMDVAGKIQGYPGIFVAGVFSTGLSTLSATLNTMSAVIYEDFLSVFLPKNLSQRRISTILKILVLVSGCFSTVLVLAFQKVKGIFPVFIGLSAACFGPSLGLFFLGVLLPVSNSKGAFYGGLSGIVFISYIFIQSQKHPIDNVFLKPFSAEGCNFTSYQNTTSKEVDLPFFIYRISFWLYTFMGALVTVTVGVIISCFSKHDKNYVSKDLLTPFIHSLVKEQLPIDGLTELTQLQTEIKEDKQLN